VHRPWLQSRELVERPNLIISTPDGTLGEIAVLLDALAGIDLDTGADVRGLRAAVGSDSLGEAGGTCVVVGAGREAVYEELRRFSIVEVAATLPDDPNPERMPRAFVGLHGFSERRVPADSSFPMQTIDDWGIEDVMAAAMDLASRHEPALAVLFDLAVLDPAFDAVGTIPGGLDLTRLLRAARISGRHPGVAAAGFVKAGSDINLVHAVLSFCAGLAGR
jgi:hypothetical protein